MYPDDIKNIMSTDDVNSTPEPKRLNLLNAIEQVVEMSYQSNLSDAYFHKAKRYLSHIGKKLSLTPMQATLFAIFIDNSNDRNIQVSDFGIHFNCRNIKIIRCLSDIEVLRNKKLIIRRKSSDGVYYRVPAEVLESLNKNEVYVPASNANISIEELFAILNNIFEQHDNDELSSEEVVGEVEALLEENKNLDFVRNLNSYEIDNDNKILLIFFCHLFVENSDDNICARDFEDLYSYRTIFSYQKRSLREGNNPLILDKRIEYVNDEGFANRDAYKLSDATKRELLGELGLQNNTNIKRGLLLHENIGEKKMYYNEREAVQVTQLTELLQVDRFNEIRERLAANGMRKGFACLFYGSPGTGKTETVLQLARQTGRDIMQLNISSIKSMWVGESEKNIKQVFDSYRILVEKSETVPILLFNEADAILGKRQEGATKAVEKMENSIQNIILQEMENLDGIFIATTNLTQNLDKAFERRFLYKIEFSKPNMESKCAIWQSMIPSLDKDKASALASQYDFSGGQIENIARKYTVDLILNSNQEISLDKFLEYCDSELISQVQVRKVVGFLK